MLKDPEEADWLTRSLGLLWVLDRSAIDRDAGSVASVVLREGYREEDLGTNPRVSLIEHEVWNTRVRMRVQVSDTCFARLSYAYFPDMDVLVDGVQVVPMETAGRFIALKLEAGTHTIELVPRVSPLRKGLWFGVFVSAVVWFAWLRGVLQRRGTQQGTFSKTLGKATDAQNTAG